MIQAWVMGIALYTMICIAVCTLVFPLWPYVVLIGVAVGLALMVVALVCTLLQVGGFTSATVTPSEVARRLPGTGTHFARDAAWPNYLFGQGRADLDAAWRHTAALVSWMWLVMVRAIARTPKLLLLWPVLALLAVGAGALTIAAIVSGSALYGLLVAALALAWVGWLLVVGVLRAVDSGVRLLRRAKATCHHAGCNYRTRLPAYRCQCGVVHHDIRAGRQGAFVRRCACGRLLPTTVVQAAAGLVAVCQRCNRDLRTGAAVLTDVLIPVFGPASAGKTRLVLAGILALSRQLRAIGRSATPVGPESEATFAEAAAVIDRLARTVKTDASQPPVGITVRLELGSAGARLGKLVFGRKILVHLFDAAGEFFSSREQNSELSFLDDAQGFVFVLDPFSIPSVADELRGALAGTLVEAQAARAHPEQSYLVTAQTLRDRGVELRRKPLAVVVVKADLLLGLPPSAGLDPTASSAGIEGWLREKRLDNMLDGAARDFGEVRFYLVSSLAPGTDPDGRATRTSPVRPLLWLLERSGAAIPEPASGATL